MILPPPKTPDNVVRLVAVWANAPEHRRTIKKHSAPPADKTPPERRRSSSKSRRVEPLFSSEASPPVDSDIELAGLFVERHGHQFRYVAQWSAWLNWDGKRWSRDVALQVRDVISGVCTQAADEGDARFGERKRIASAKTVRSVEWLAQASRSVASTTDEWDLDPWLLNTPGGTWDLRKGDLRPHEPADSITKLTAASVDRSRCPKWFAFLDRVTAGDLELQCYLQRMVGYMLTGSTEEHAMFFLHGGGTNGKSVFVETVAGLLGDYHTTAPIEVFMASHNDRHPTELAMLRGARLVTAIETEEGRRWAETKIKALTGGDRIAARFMRQDFFEFTPTFKLLIAGNHRPRLRSVDEAIRRRFNLIPFTVTIPPAERDPKLGEKLKAEWPGILFWAIEGYIDWRREGLNPPAAVRDATAAYFEAQDAMTAWLDECCTFDPSGHVARTELFGSWQDWTKRNGEYPGSARAFYEALEKRGFRPTKWLGERRYLGLTLALGQVGAG